MRVLFVMRNEGYVRNYASVIRMLASRGHTVIVGSRGLERHMAVSTEAFVAELRREFPTVERALLPKRDDAWTAAASTVRAARNALRYRHPRFRDTPKLTARAVAHLARHAPWAARLAARAPWPAARVLLAALDRAEEAIPTAPAIDTLLAELRPDAVLVTPLIDFNSFQVDYVKSARRRGTPVAAAVASWDNLTNKGLIHVQPDEVFVWNEAQAEEATVLHGVPRGRIAVTGAQLFDDWFDRRPSMTREAFCADLGLDPRQPLVLYLCSSLFIAPDEVPFVRRWLQALRAAPDPALRACGVLIRPHPGNAGPWADVDLTALGPVAIAPRAGEMPLFDAAKASYFDALFHAGAIVGINTSAMIEAAILGKRTLTVLAPEFSATQDGTLHFQHVAPILRKADDLDAHLRHLVEELGGERESVGPFVEAFVRPAGLGQPATPLLADAVERLAARRPAPIRSRAGAALWRAALRPRRTPTPSKRRAAR